MYELELRENPSIDHVHESKRNIFKKKQKKIKFEFISSRIICVKSCNVFVKINFCKRTPVVQYKILVNSQRCLFKLVWYPTVCPTDQPRKCDICSQSELAAIRRGWVTTILQGLERLT